MITKKAITSIVSMLLLIGITVTAIIGYQIFYTNFQSSLLTNLETTINNNNEIVIETIIGNTLYLKNSKKENYTLNNLKIGENTCNLQKNLTPGLNQINISSCIKNLNSQLNEVILFTNEGIKTKTILINKIKLTNSQTPTPNPNQDKIKLKSQIAISTKDYNIEISNFSINSLQTAHTIIPRDGTFVRSIQWSEDDSMIFVWTTKTFEIYNTTDGTKLYNHTSIASKPTSYDHYACEIDNYIYYISGYGSTNYQISTVKLNKKTFTIETESNTVPSSSRQKSQIFQIGCRKALNNNLIIAYKNDNSYSNRFAEVTPDTLNILGHRFPYTGSSYDQRETTVIIDYSNNVYLVQYPESDTERSIKLQDENFLKLHEFTFYSDFKNGNPITPAAPIIIDRTDNQTIMPNAETLYFLNTKTYEKLAISPSNTWQTLNHDIKQAYYASDNFYLINKKIYDKNFKYKYSISASNGKSIAISNN